MIIEIENTSSPGASFTENTNLVLLKTYEWICEHKGLQIPFREFRKKLQEEKKINDNNNRNIYPLLKNGDLVSYEKGELLRVDYFYTNTGLAYVKTLEAMQSLDKDRYSSEQIIIANQKFEEIKSEIIYGALKSIVKKPDVNYIEPFQDMIQFLLKYNKISKVEFAYLLYVKQKNELREALFEMGNNIDLYRCGEIDIEVQVKVRNDIVLRKETMSDKRKEGLGFLTSYGYFISLLSQAGLIKKDGKYYLVREEKRKLLEELGGI